MADPGACYEYFSYWHIHNASKEYFWSKKISNFMHRFKSAILAIFQFFQNGTFEPVHEIWNFFWPKVFFWSIMRMPIRKNIHNMPQGSPNSGFMQEKVQKGDFLIKPTWELKNYFCFRIEWILRIRRHKINNFTVLQHGEVKIFWNSTEYSIRMWNRRNETCDYTIEKGRKFF